MNSIGLRRQGDVHAVIDDEKTVAGAGLLAYLAGQLEKIFCGQIFHPELNNRDSALEKSLKDGARGTSELLGIEDGVKR